MGSIGSRVQECIRNQRPDALQREVAEKIGMSPDALSRALNGSRQFSSIELARVADYLSADLHWLITGVPDPNRLTVAARHTVDFETWERNVPGRVADEQTIQDIALAYRQAYRDPVDLHPLPRTVEEVRLALGDEFVRPFADRIEQRLEIGVVRVAELSTAYSFIVGGRRVIAIPATGNWFHENFSLAHELGHLVLGHHDENLTEDVSHRHEEAAQDFAAQLLLPVDEVKEVSWDMMSDAQLADIVWRWGGVSTKALAQRLANLFSSVPSPVGRWAASPTQRLLRRHLAIDPPHDDEITRRMDEASSRRFPLDLREAHLNGIAAGILGKGTLAWMLGIAPPDGLDVDAPDIPEVGSDDLALALGL